MSFTEVFGGSTIYPSDVSYLSLTLTSDVTLLWPVETQINGDLIVADIIEVSAAAGGRIVNLPDARLAATGFTALFNNVGAQTVTIKDANGGTIVSVTSGEAWQIYLRNNTTLGGLWRTFQYGAGTSTANAAALAGAGLMAITTTLNQKMDVNSKSSNYVILDADRAQAITWTNGNGSFSLPDPSVVGASWFVAIRNSGTGTLTVTPAAGLIDGAANKVFSLTNSAFVVTDGTNYFTIGFGQAINAVFDFISINVGGTGNYILNSAEQNRISYDLTGVLTGNRDIIVPNLIQQYWIANDTSGAFILTVKTAAGAGVAVARGSRRILYCDGTSVLDAETVISVLPVPIADGGTGATTAAAARTNLGSSAVGDAVFVAGSAIIARAALGASATGDAVFISATAAIARAALGSTTVGDAVFIAANAAAGRSALGSSATGDAVFVSASAAAARSALGSSVVGDAIFISASTAVARSALGSSAVGDAVFVAANTTAAQSALGASAIGQALFISASAAAARGTIGSDDASNLTSGTIATARLGSGAASSTTALFGDSSWKVIGGIGLKFAFGRVIGNTLQADSSGVTSVTHSGTGVWDLDLTAAGFSTIPCCVATDKTNQLNTPESCAINVSSTVAAQVTNNVQGIGPADGDYQFFCVGF